MKWPGRFTDALANAGEVFNYYSSGDSVFVEENDIPSPNTCPPCRALWAERMWSPIA